MLTINYSHFIPKCKAKDIEYRVENLQILKRLPMLEQQKQIHRALITQ